MGDLHGDPVLSPLRCLFFFGAAYTGIPFFFRCAVCFLNLPLGGLYGDSRFFSTPPIVLFWVGSSFFLRFQCGAVLYFRCMALYERRFEFAVSWLCECRLSHLVGGVNKKNTLPGGRPAKMKPAGAGVRGAGEPQAGGQ